MITSIRNRFLNFFINGDKRTILAKKNIALSFIIKSGSILISLSLVPLTINYTTPAQYGIWLTISSIIGWLNFFDIGLGNGLKNNLTQSIALGRTEEAKSYISTAYVSLLIVSIVIFFIFLIINSYTNWNLILNISANELNNLETIILVVTGCFCIQFIVQAITIILTATHQSAKASFISLISQSFVLIIIILIGKYQYKSLLILISVLAGTPIFTLLIATAILFRTSLKDIAPNLKLVKVSYAKNLLKTGSLFFIIQIGALVLFQTDNIIITQILGPEQVTIFNVNYKLFSVVTMGFTIVVTPLWSAFTDAFVKKDFAWIANNLAKMKKIWFLFSIITIGILCFSQKLFNLWLGNKIVIPLNLSISMALYVIAYTWQTMHVFMLNGVGKVRLQLILVIICSILNIPLAIFLGKSIGLPGVIYANTILFVGMGIVFSIQCNLIARQVATKIWNK